MPERCPLCCLKTEECSRVPEDGLFGLEQFRVPEDGLFGLEQSRVPEDGYSRGIPSCDLRIGKTEEYSRVPEDGLFGREQSRVPEDELASR